MNIQCHSRPFKAYRMNKTILTTLLILGSLSAGAAENNGWVKIGSGLFTDIVISSIYNTNGAKISVDFEQSESDPNTYRIKAPYANWSDRRAEKISYRPAEATPLVFHVVNDKYAWFEQFNTGLYVEEADDYGPIVGMITVVPTVEALIKTYGVQTVYANYPSAFCVFDAGTLTLTELREEDNSPNVRLDVAGEPIWKGNKNSRFKMQLPTAEDLDPEMKWNTLEKKAKFTDDFTTLFAYQDEPQTPTLEVEIQQNQADPDHYRLVNPYAEWNIAYSAYDIEYDTDNNYYIHIYTFPELELACTDTFLTGLNVRQKGSDDPFEMFGVQNTAYYFYFSYASSFGWWLIDVAQDFGYMLGTFEDGIFTCPATYQEEYSGQMMDFPTFTGWTGDYDEAEELGYTYQVNKHGAFRVEIPQGKADSSGTTMLPQNETETLQYYDLQGRRIMNPAKGSIVIERRGSQVRKIIVPE